MAGSQGWHPLLCFRGDRRNPRRRRRNCRIRQNHPRHHRATKAEEALRDSERQFRLLVTGVTDYALYMLDPNGLVVSWNAGARRIKGYAADEIIGQHFSKFYFDGDRAAGLPARALATAAQEGRYEAEGWRVRKDGSFFWASVVIDAIHDDQGALAGFAKITRDITERREAQATLQKMQKQLAESQKMDALGQLTGGVAHDFNNLLMVVSGHIQTLKKRVADDPRATRAAEAIELAAQRGAALTRQLLTFSRRQHVNPSATDISEQLASFREILASGVGSAERLAIHVPAATWPVKVDVAEFEIALVNLVINARDAMPDGGAVTITAENIVLDPSGDDIATSREFVALTVADTGVGIPDDVLPRIFDPFFTTKPVGKGTGLGLSQVYGFAHQAGGTVKVESGLGKGTRITMYLPRAYEAPVAAEGHDRATDHRGANTVLLVEDNPEVASASKGLLEQLGCNVQCVSRRGGRAARAGTRPHDRPRVHRRRHARSNGRIGTGACDQRKASWLAGAFSPPATATRCATSAGNFRFCASRTRSASSAAPLPR